MGRQSLVRRVAWSRPARSWRRSRGLGGCLRVGVVGRVGAPRTVRGARLNGTDPQHNDLQGRIRLAWRPVDLRLLQHALWPRHRRPPSATFRARRWNDDSLDGVYGERSYTTRRVCGDGERHGICDRGPHWQGDLALARRDYGAKSVVDSAPTWAAGHRPARYHRTPVIDAATTRSSLPRRLN